MAHYTLVIEDKEASPGKPRYVFISMTDNWYETFNTWVINQPNNWVGTGTGQYKVAGFSHDVLEFRDGPWENGKTRMQLFNIRYPDDCAPSSGGIKSGAGVYLSPYHVYASGLKLEWSGREIVPEP